MLKVTEAGSFRIDRSPVADRWVARLAAMGPIPPIIGAVLLLFLLGAISPVLVWLAVMLGLVGGVFAWLYITGAGQWVEVDPVRRIVRLRSDRTPDKPSLNHRFASFRAVRIVPYSRSSSDNDNPGPFGTGAFSTKRGNILCLVFLDESGPIGPGRGSFDRIFDIARSHDLLGAVAYDDATMTRMAAQLAEVIGVSVD